MATSILTSLPEGDGEMITSIPLISCSRDEGVATPPSYLKREQKRIRRMEAVISSSPEVHIIRMEAGIPIY